MSLQDRPILGGALTPVVLVNPISVGNPANPIFNYSASISVISTPFISVEITLALDTNAYAIGDVFSNTIEVPGAVRVAGGRSLLHSAVVYDLDDQGFGIDLIPLRANVSLGTRNLPPAIGDASIVNVLGYVTVGASDFKDLGGARIAVMSTIGQMVEAAAGSTSIYLGTLVQGAGTYSASGVKVRLDFIPE